MKPPYLFSLCFNTSGASLTWKKKKNRKRKGKKRRDSCVHARVWWSLKAEKQQGSYRSGGIALINGVFEVCAQLIKGNNLKNNRQRELISLQLTQDKMNSKCTSPNSNKSPDKVVLTVCVWCVLRLVQLQPHIVDCAWAPAMIKCWVSTSLITYSFNLFLPSV